MPPAVEDLLQASPPPGGAAPPPAPGEPHDLLSPLGYVFTIDSKIPDRRLFEITHFSRYRYDDLKVLEMKPVVLDTPTFIHGDYRKPDEVVREGPPI